MSKRCGDDPFFHIAERVNYRDWNGAVVGPPMDKRRVGWKEKITGLFSVRRLSKLSFNQWECSFCRCSFMRIDDGDHSYLQVGQMLEHKISDYIPSPAVDIKGLAIYYHFGKCVKKHWAFLAQLLLAKSVKSR